MKSTVFKGCLRFMRNSQEGCLYFSKVHKTTEADCLVADTLTDFKELLLKKTKTCHHTQLFPQATTGSWVPLCDNNTTHQRKSILFLLHCKVNTTEQEEKHRPTTVPRVHRSQTLMASENKWLRGGLTLRMVRGRVTRRRVGFVCACPPRAVQNVWHKSLNRRAIQKRDI